jgi:type VI secretion system (T6SS)-associated protein TagF
MALDYLPAGCFGKLPLDREYLESNVVLGSSKAFRQWILDGRAAAGMSPGVADGTIPPETHKLRALVTVEGSGEVLAAVIRPSADLGGRIFPFAVFAHVHRRPWSRRFHLLPIAARPTWDALDDLWDALAAVASKSAFAEILAATLIPSPRPPDEVSATYESGQSSRAASLFEREDGTSFAALKVNLPMVLKELKTSSTSRLDLPASHDTDDAAFDAAFWVDLINRQFLWHRHEPSVFYDTAPTVAAGRLFLAYGNLRDEDYPPVLGLSGTPTRFSRPAHRPDGKTPPEGAPEAPTYAELASTRFVA